MEGFKEREKESGGGIMKEGRGGWVWCAERDGAVYSASFSHPVLRDAPSRTTSESVVTTLTVACNTDQ